MLLFSAGFCSPALAASTHILVCDTNTQLVPPHSIGLVSCTTPSIPLASVGLVTGFTLNYVSGDTSSSAGSVIASVEGTMNFLDATATVWDFFDVVFSPYAGVPGGGTPPANITYGGTNSPNLFLPKAAILADPIAKKNGITLTDIQFELQVFVNNPTAGNQFASESLRVVAFY
jgi:hypothetical protein